MPDRSVVRSNRDEVTRAAHELGTPETQFRILSEEEARPILGRIESHFVGKAGLRWWWEAFRPLPTTHAHFPDGAGWRHLNLIIPPDSGLVWFVVEDYPTFTLCEGSLDAVQSIIGDCSAFEYYVVSRRLDWLVCENHSDVIYAVGERVADRLSEVVILLDYKV